MDIDELEHFVCSECMGSNMELIGIITTDSGIEVDLYDYLEKVTDFKSDCESLVDDVTQRLDDNMKCKLKYISDHCILTIDVV